MSVLFSRCCLFSVLVFSVLISSNAAVVFTEDFNSYSNGGFASSPASGQLDSDVWRVVGLDDGDGTFGGTHTSGKFTRGTSTGNVSSGGVYAFNIDGAGDIALGMQQTNGDLTPGSFELRLTNSSGSAITTLTVSYDLIVFNNEHRSSSFDLTLDTDDDGTCETATTGFATTTPVAEDAPVSWQTTNFSNDITGLNIANGQTYRLCFESDDSSGSGSRDEFGIDNISIEDNTGGDVVAPILSSAEIASADITLTFNEDIDTGNEPETENFIVKVNGSTVPLTSVDSIGSTELDMTLSIAVAEGDTVTISYTGSALRDASGNEVANFSDEVVTNNTDTTAPLLSSASILNDAITLTFDESLDSANEPVTDNFVINVDNSEVNLSSVDLVSGANVTMTLSSATSAGDAVTISYSGNALRDDAGNQVIGFSDAAVTNNTVALIINEVLSDPLPGYDANGDGNANTSQDEFIEFVNNGGTVLDISNWTVSDRTRSRHTFASNTELQPGQAIVLFGAGTPTGDFGGSLALASSTGELGLNNTGDTITVNNGLVDVIVYNTISPSDQSETRNPDLTGDFEAHTTADSVDNAVASPGTQLDGSSFVIADIVAPLLNSASITNTSLTLTFDEALHSDSVPETQDFTVTVGSSLATISSVSVSDTDVSLTLAATVGVGDPVTISYSGEALRDLSDNEVANFSDEVVTNNTSDATSPTFYSASINGAALVVRFDESLDSGSLPGTGDLTIDVNNLSVALTSVDSVSNTDLLLTLSSAVIDGDIVTVSYSGTALRDSAGNQVASFSDASVTNNSADSTAPTFLSAVADTTTLTLTFDEALDSGNEPGIGDFEVDEGTSPVTLSSVSVSGYNVVVTLTNSLIQGTTVTVSYTGTALRDVAGNQVVSFSDEAVTNNTVDDTAPSFASGSINANAISLSFDENLDDSNVPGTSNFTVYVNGSPVTLASVDSVSGTVVALTLSSSVISSDTITLSYSGTALRDAFGNQVASFSDQSLSNDTVDTVAPILQSAVVEDATLTLTFDEDLDSASTPDSSDFVISGGTSGLIAITNVAIGNSELTLTLQSAVPQGVTVNLDHTQGSNPMQDDSGNGVASFNDRAITNGTAASATSLVLNEINADPDSSSGDANGDSSVDSSDDEFLEFVNVSGSALDVSGWTISDSDSVRHTVSDDSVLYPGQALVVFGGGTPTGSFGDAIVQIASSGRLQLNNAGDTVVVNDGSTDVLSVAYSGAASDQSITLDPDLLSSISYAQHETADTTDSSSFSPGTQVDGNGFVVTDITAPSLVSASAEGTSISLTYSETLDSTSIPDTGDYTVTSSSNGSISVSNVAVNASVVTLTLASNVGEGTVSMDYVVGNNPIQDPTGNNAIALSGQEVSNDTDTTAPALVSAIVNNTSLLLRFDETLDDSSLPAASDFQVTGSTSGAVSGSSLVINDTLVTVTLASSLINGETTSLSFTNTGDLLRDASSGLNPVADISNFGLGNTTGITPVINEFIRDQSGDDDDEFVEILTTPGADLSNYALLQVELDLTSDVGSIDSVTTLGTADELGFIRENFSADLENGNIGLFLVEGFTGSEGDDLDSNDDEVIDNEPWITLHDSVAATDDSTDGAGLAQTVLFVGFSSSEFEVGGASRSLDGLDTDSPADWVRNDFSGEGVIDGVSDTTETDEAFNTPGESNRINVATPSNQPELTMPSGQEVLTGSSLSLSGLSVAETDNVSLILQLTVDAGTLSVSSEITDGADSLNITGSGTDRVHIAGTVAQINNTLSSQFLYQAPGAETTVTLTAVAADGLLGSDTDTITITVTDTPTNFPTENTVPGTTVAASSSGSATIGSNISISDAGGASETFSITITTLKGTLSATAESGVSITGNGTASITLESTDLAAINTTLQSLTLSANGYAGASLITVASSDGIGGADSDTFIVNITSGGSSTDITIEQIQGTAHSSGLVGESVTITGEVTATKTSGDDGFYLQAVSEDGDDRTSSAIFVFTDSTPTVAVGNRITVTGTVAEDIGSSTDLSETRITQPTIDSNDNDTTLDITAVTLGDGGRAIPTDVIEDDSFTSFDITTDGIDYFEALESMYVAVNNPVAISLDDGDDFHIVADNGDNATGYNTERSVLVISGGSDDSTFDDDDFNPEKIKVSDTLPGISTPSIAPGDQLDNLTGIMASDGDGFALFADVTINVAQANNITEEVSSLESTAGQLTVAGMNVENLDPSDDQTKFDGMANVIVDHMNNPDIIALQEVQDNSGSTNGDDVIAADQTAQALIDAIEAETNGATDYAYFDFHPVNGREGGQPGGNIRVGYLFRTSRITLALPAGPVDTGTTLVDSSGVGTSGTSSLTVRIPDKDSGSDTSYIDDGEAVDDAYSSTRIPASAQFTFTPTGEEITIVNVHFSSRGGSDPLFGSVQPPATNEDKREAQAHVVRDFVEDIISGDSDANIIVIGDYNTFGFSSTVDILENAGNGDNMHNLEDALSDDKRFSFEFDGNAQTLDHLLVSNNLNGKSPEFEKVHVNVGFEDAASDHDPLLARFTLNTAVVIDGTPTTSIDQSSFYSFTPNVTNTDGDSLVFSIENQPDWASFNSTTGTLYPSDFKTPDRNAENCR